LDLLYRYIQPGPRYTSYPTESHFSDKVPKHHRFEGERAPLSLYFHLPFCSSQCLYCDAANIITSDASQSATYLNYLEQELTLRRPFIHKDSDVHQIHLGGGSPTFFQPDEIEQLGQLIRSTFPIAEQLDAGLEIDPRALTLEKIQAFRAAGFTRASLGVQDTNPQVQQAIARVQPLEMIAEKNALLRAHGFTSINFDLIYGLPHQTVKSFNQTLNDVLALNPDRFAIHSYDFVPWLKPFQKSTEEHLPSPETKLRLLKLMVERLTTEGYIHIGMGHFTKPDDALAVALEEGTLHRHFHGYSTQNACELHGFGISAISHASVWYFQNHNTLESYYAELDNQELPIQRGYIMTAEDQLRYHVIMRIMCDPRVDYEALSKAIGVDFKAHFKYELDSLHNLELDGLIIRKKDGLIITPVGRLFIQAIAMRFDAYLREDRRQGRHV
ncbi:MAG: oxygen-independent coproporphyrinogen III oxidase, partial [Pontiellaceae bacterium]|nr:oxygen-independent coproporphyrinogen III oxidase [Pontiellaceae bacterium]